MPHGSPSRQTAVRFAPFLLLALCGACQRPMLQRIEPDAAPASIPSPTSATTTTAASAVAAEAESVFPPMPPPRTVTQVSSPPSAPTPALDAVAQKRETLKQAALESIPDPDLEPRDLPKPQLPKPAAPAPGAEPTTSAKASPSQLAVPDEKRASASKPVTIDPEKTPAPRKPEELWREATQRLRSLVRERKGAPGRAPADWTLREQLLGFLAELDADAPSTGPWRTVLAALSEPGTSGPKGDPARATAIRAAVEALEELAPLEISDLRLCRKVNGFASFESIDGPACRAGQTVIVYCELIGIRYESSGDAFLARTTAEIEVLSADGAKTLWNHPLGTAEDACPRKRRDYYVNYQVNLPKTLVPGSYLLRLKQTDLATTQTATRSIPLVIRP